MNEDWHPKRPPRPCPICKKMSVPDFHPFCSKRCADVDLSRWFGGVYAVPAAETPMEEDGEAPDETPRDDRSS